MGKGRGVFAREAVGVPSSRTQPKGLSDFDRLELETELFQRFVEAERYLAAMDTSSATAESLQNDWLRSSSLEERLDCVYRAETHASDMRLGIITWESAAKRVGVDPVILRDMVNAVMQCDDNPFASYADYFYPVLAALRNRPPIYYYDRRLTMVQTVLAEKYGIAGAPTTDQVQEKDSPKQQPVSAAAESNSTPAQTQPPVTLPMDPSIPWDQLLEEVIRQQGGVAVLKDIYEVLERSSHPKVTRGTKWQAALRGVLQRNRKFCRTTDATGRSAWTLSTP